MFKIEYRKSGEEWRHWMNISGLIHMIEEKKRLLSQGFEVRILNVKGEVVL